MIPSGIDNKDSDGSPADKIPPIIHPYDAASTIQRMQAIAPSLKYTNPLGMSNLVQQKSREEKWIAAAMESCVSKAIISGVAGWGLGVAFGLLTSGMDPAISGTDVRGAEKLKSTKQVLAFMKSRAGSYGKNFGTFGFVFMALECMLEYQRGSTDLKNTAMAGCATGGLIGLRAGALAGVGGCAGVAGFSLAVDYFLRFS